MKHQQKQDNNDLFAFTPRARDVFRLSLKEELHKAHIHSVSARRNSLFADVQNIINRYLQNIKQIFIMHKKLALVTVPTFALMVVVASALVLQPFSSVGQMVNGAGFIKAAHASYEQNLKTSILHQTLTPKDGKDIAAYAKVMGMSVKELREELVLDESEEFWMDDVSELSLFDGEYLLFTVDKNGDPVVYSSDSSDCTIETISNEDWEKEFELDEESFLSIEELGQTVEDVDILDDTGCFISVIVDSENSELTVDEYSMNDEFRFMEELAKEGEVEAYEYTENGKTFIAFDDKMVDVVDEYIVSDIAGEDVEVFFEDEFANIYSRLVFDKESKELVKEIIMAENDGVVYEVSELQIHTQWLNKTEGKKIFNPDTYGLKKTPMK